MRPATPEPTARRALPFGLNATFVRETGWLAGGFASKLVINLGTLYYLTHNLGVAGTGTFFALISLLACMVPFVQLGNYDLTVRDIARRLDPQMVAGRAMRSSAAAFACVLPILALLRPWVAPHVGWTAFLLVSTGELLVMRVIGNVQAVATGFRLHYVAATSDFLLGASRLAAMYVAYRLAAGVDAVLTLYAFTSLPAAVIVYAWLVRRIGHPALTGGRLFSEVGDHLRMVVAWFAEMAAREGDKPLLATLAGPAQAGIYGTATKLLTVVLVPVDVLTQVFRPRISRAYADGPAQGKRMHRVMTLGLFSCGALAGAGLLAVAVLAPHVAPSLLKGEFAEARLALIFLSVIPPFYGLQRAGVIDAIARGATTRYAASMIVSATMGVGTLLIIGGRFGWRGACVASVAYVCMTCLTMWASASRTTTSGRPSTAHRADEVLPAIEAAAAS